MCAALLPAVIKVAQVNSTLAAAAAHSLNNAQNLLRVQLVDAIMIDPGCTDVTWSHAWNSVCGSSHHHFLLVCGRLVDNIQGIQEALLLQTPRRTLVWTSGSNFSCTGYSHLCNWNYRQCTCTPQPCPCSTGADCLPENSPSLMV